MNAITQLEQMGYTFTIEGDKLRYALRHKGQLPDSALVRPLLAELNHRKSEAIQFLQTREQSIPADPAPPFKGWPVLIIWPSNTPTAVFPSWRRLEGGEIEAIYTNEAELRESIHALALAKEAQALGGVIGGKMDCLYISEDRQ
jgi:hypothetical protein